MERNVGFIEFYPKDIAADIDIKESVPNYQVFIYASKYVHSEEEQQKQQEKLIKPWSLRHGFEDIKDFCNSIKLPWKGNNYKV